MNLKDRIKFRVLLNLVIGVIQRLVNLIIKISPSNKPTVVPKRKRPLKKAIDTINSVIPWRKKDE